MAYLNASMHEKVSARRMNTLPTGGIDWEIVIEIGSRSSLYLGAAEAEALVAQLQKALKSEEVAADK